MYLTARFIFMRLILIVAQEKKKFAGNAELF